MSKSLVELTAELVQAQIATKDMSPEQIKAALNDTFMLLKGLQNAESCGCLSEQADCKPAIAPEKSIQKNQIVCIECGQAFKMLSPKHLSSHELTPKEYRKKHGFTMRQPLCAKVLSERRSVSGKARGIPENLKKAIVARTKKKK